MPDVDIPEKTNGHHEEANAFSLDDMLSPHPVSSSGAAAESTDETSPPAEHVEEETKDGPAEKVPSKSSPTKPPATGAKKARVVSLDDLPLNKLKLTFHPIFCFRLTPRDPPVLLWL